MFVSRNLKILLILVVYAFRNHGMAMDALSRAALPLFQIITKSGREIYVLGSAHTTPLLDFSPHPTIHALHQLADRNAILYTEHEVTNRAALEYLKDNENLTKRPGVKPFSNLGIIKNDFNKIQNSKIFLDETQESGVFFSQILNAKPWLFAAIIGIHANILSYRKYGGLEHDLHQKGWKEKWADIRYLETPEQVIETLKRNMARKVDSDLNQSWIKKSMGRIMDFYALNTAPSPAMAKLLEEDIRTERNNHNHLYSWEAIATGNRQTIPHSAIDRNQLWADVVAEEVTQNPHDPRPILAVIGMGHLAGFRHNFSFLSFLFKTLA